MLGPRCRPMIPGGIGTLSTDLSFPRRREESDQGDMIQFKPAPSGYQMSCLLYPAACDSII